MVHPRNLVAWVYGSWTEKCCGNFGWRPPWSGGGPCPLLFIPCHSPYNWGKARKTCQSRLVATALIASPIWLSFEGLPRLACWTSDHTGYQGDFSQPSVGTGAFRVAVLRGSPHQLTSSQNSRSGSTNTWRQNLLWLVFKVLAACVQMSPQTARSDGISAELLITLDSLGEVKPVSLWWWNEIWYTYHVNFALSDVRTKD
jgi:hypothetical protein